MQSAEKIKGDGGEFRFVFVGRIVRDKGICELVEVFMRLNAECDDVRLMLVGRLEDELDPLPSHTRKAIDICHNIEFVGYQSDVRPYLVASDVLVLPPYREGFPNVVLQAGAMGLPVIVTDVNGSDEVIEQGVNGIILPKYDVEALYSAMIAMVNDSARTKQTAEVARKMIADRFDQRDVWEAILDMYRQLSD